MFFRRQPQEGNGVRLSAARQEKLRRYAATIRSASIWSRL